MESRVPIFDLNCLPEIELKSKIEFSFDLNHEPDMDLSLMKVPELAKQTDINAGKKGRRKRPRSQASVNQPGKRMRVYQFMDICSTILEPGKQQKSCEVVQVGPKEAETDGSYSADLHEISKTIVEAKAPPPMEIRASIFLFRTRIDLNCKPKKEFSFDLNSEPKKEFSFDLNCEPKTNFPCKILVPELAKEIETQASKGRGKRPQSLDFVTPPLKKIWWQQSREISSSIPELKVQHDSFEAVPVGVKEAGIDEIDLPDLNDVVRSGVQYVKELYVFYDKQQHLHRPRDYMHLQRKLDSDMRASLVHWMIGMHSKLHLEPETLYLAVSIMDRFLSWNPVDSRQLRYVGISSLVIASKYEEDWAPRLYQFIDVAGDDYTGAQVRYWEKKILNILEWYLTVPTVYMFLLRYVKAAKADEELESLIYYSGELGLKQYSLILYCPSLVAAATVYAARLVLQKSPVWTDALQRHTSFCESQLLDCAQVILRAHLDVLLKD